MFQIDGDRLVPRCRSDVGHLMAGVIAGIVHQNINCMKSVQNGVYGVLYVADVGRADRLTLAGQLRSS